MAAITDKSSYKMLHVGPYFCTATHTSVGRELHAQVDSTAQHSTIRYTECKENPPLVTRQAPLRSLALSRQLGPPAVVTDKIIDKY
jgi:hypothetical protein